MGFTMASPAEFTALTAPGPARSRNLLPPLGKTWKGYTSPGVYERVKAVTADGEWLFARAADGTWSAGHLPTKTELKAGLRDLAAARRYAGTGKARADLERVQAHQRGDHENEESASCPRC